MGTPTEGMEIIDPFSEESRDLSSARSDAHYKKRYEELFEKIPTRARSAIAKGYAEYVNECTKPFVDLLNPVGWINPVAVFADAVQIHALRCYLVSTQKP